LMQPPHTTMNGPFKYQQLQNAPDIRLLNVLPDKAGEQLIPRTDFPRYNTLNL